MWKPKQNLYQFLGSLKLSIPLIFLIAAVAVTGTLIPQGLTNEQYHRVFSPFVFNLLDRLQIFDVYHSVFFITLLSLFAFNLIICSYRRFPAVWRIARSRSAPWPKKTSERVFHADFQLPAKSETDLKALLKNFLRHSFAPPREISGEEDICFFAQKGAWSRLAVFLAHFSILLILAGALVGGTLGFKAFVTIPEGRSVTEIQLDRSKEIISLGFTVRCDKFTVEYYDSSCRPRKFESLISIIDAGKVTVDRQPVTVNNPLIYKGTHFYQSNFGPASDPTLHINVHNLVTNEKATYSVNSSERIPLANGGLFRVLRFSPCFRDLGPVALLEIYPVSAKPFILPVFNKTSTMNQNHNSGPLNFSLAGFDQPYYTGLLINRDPGVWFVWSGFILLTVGLLMAFATAHRRIWVSASRRDNLVHIHLWGDTQRNPVAYERCFHDLCVALETALSSAKEEGA